MEPFQRLIIPHRASWRACARSRAATTSPLIFDEIVTGFRFAYGGAQEYYGVVPDLAAVGKIIGGGFPLAAVVGREDIMRHLAPDLEGTPEFVPRRARSTATRSPRPPGWPRSPSSASPAPTSASSRPGTA